MNCSLFFCKFFPIFFLKKKGGEKNHSHYANVTYNGAAIKEKRSRRHRNIIVRDAWYELFRFPKTELNGTASVMFANVWNNVSECSLAVIAQTGKPFASARRGAREFTLGENFMHMRRKWILYKRARARGDVNAFVSINGTLWDA